MAAQNVAELRYGALVAEWGEVRQDRLEAAIASTTVVPVTDRLMHRVAQLRFECRSVGHPLVAPAHTADLWIATTALRLDAPLVTADQVFDGAPGLTLT